jgi:hypothetical protein
MQDNGMKGFDNKEEINKILPSLWAITFTNVELTDTNVKSMELLHTWKSVGASLLGNDLFYSAWKGRKVPYSLNLTKLLLKVEPDLINERTKVPVRSKMLCETSQVPIMIIKRKFQFPNIKWYLENTSADINDELIMLNPITQKPTGPPKSIIHYLLDTIVDNAFSITYKKRRISVRGQPTSSMVVPDVYLPYIDNLTYDVEMCKNILKLQRSESFARGDPGRRMRYTLPPVESEQFLVHYFDNRIREALQIYSVRTTEFKEHFNANWKKSAEEATKSAFTELWTYYIRPTYEMLIQIHKMAFGIDEVHRKMDKMYEKIIQDVKDFQGRRSRWHRLHNNVDMNDSAPLWFSV